MSTHALLQPMMDWPDVQIDGLQATKCALHLGERLVGAHGLGVCEGRFRQAGSHGVETVERRLLGDRLGLASVSEACIRYREFKMLGHLVLVEHGADGQADLRRAA